MSSNNTYNVLYIRDELFIIGGGGGLHFHVMYNKFYYLTHPPTPNPAGKNLDPPRYMTKMFVTPW